MIAKRICTSGLRLMECLRLRAKDLAFGRRPIIDRDGKGALDRVTALLDRLAVQFWEHLLLRRRARSGEGDASPVASHRYSCMIE